MSNYNLLIVSILGFSSGLPFLLTSQTLQAWWTAEGLNLTTVGLLSLAGLPYSIKFLWAPVIDTIKLPILSNKKQWIILCQVLLAISLLLLAQLGMENISTLVYLCIFINFIAATQDVCVDGYRIEVLSKAQYPMGIALSTNLYRLAMFIAGPVALILASKYSWSTTYSLMGLVFALLTYTTLKFANNNNHIIKNDKVTVKNSAKDLFEKKNIKHLILLAFFFKFGDYFAAAMTQPFLQRELSLSIAELAYIGKTSSILGMIVGSFFAVFLLKKTDFKILLFNVAIIQSLVNLTYLILLSYSNYQMIYAVCFLENMIQGISTTVLISYIMNHCSKEYSATQFAIFTSIITLPRIIVGPLAGFVADGFGWPLFFAISFVLSIPSILLTANFSAITSQENLNAEKAN